MEHSEGEEVKETEVYYEGWESNRRHKIKNEDLEMNKGIKFY